MTNPYTKDDHRHYIFKASKRMFLEEQEASKLIMSIRSSNKNIKV